MLVEKLYKANFQGLKIHRFIPYVCTQVSGYWSSYVCALVLYNPAHTPSLKCLHILFCPVIPCRLNKLLFQVNLSSLQKPWYCLQMIYSYDHSYRRGFSFQLKKDVGTIRILHSIHARDWSTHIDTNSVWMCMLANKKSRRKRTVIEQSYSLLQLPIATWELSLQTWKTGNCRGIWRVWKVKEFSLQSASLREVELSFLKGAASDSYGRLCEDAY